MKNFLYGIVFGLAGMYLYMTEGAFVHGMLDSALGWRDGARGSISGYGGTYARKP